VKNKKSLIVFLLIFLLMAGILGYRYLNQSPQSAGSENNPSEVSANPTDQNFLLEGYPEEVVPLYKSVKVSSSKFFVNDDPQSFGGEYFGNPVNYYNVVFETEATPEEMLNYYRSLMSETNPDSVSDESVEGKIGKYKVEASHFGDDPANYGYLQVYLPAEEFQKTNRYFQNYPNVVEIQESWPEHESSFGYLNQKGGEIEYWQFFPLTDDETERANLIKTYQEKYQNETGYSYNEETGLMNFSKDGYSVNMTFSEDHGRIYLMMRTGM